jgi:hypothetical protein
VLTEPEVKKNGSCGDKFSARLLGQRRKKLSGGAACGGIEQGCRVGRNWVRTPCGEEEGVGMRWETGTLAADPVMRYLSFLSCFWMERINSIN